MKSLVFCVMVMLVFCTHFSGVSCQNQEAVNDNFKEGEYFFNRGEYKDAVIYYLKLIDIDSLNANYNFKVGECYLNIPSREHLAIPYFQKATRSIVPKNKFTAIQTQMLPS